MNWNKARIIMIKPDESEITGKWIAVQGGIVGDGICRRIFDLVKNHLIKLGRDQSGWDVLYRDPTDGRLWELIYPQSELHGGGPPQLQYLTVHEARQKYGNVALDS